MIRNEGGGDASLVIKYRVGLRSEDSHCSCSLNEDELESGAGRDSGGTCHL